MFSALKGLRSSERQNHSILEVRAGANVTGAHRPDPAACGSTASLKVRSYPQTQADFEALRNFFELLL